MSDYDPPPWEQDYSERDARLGFGHAAHLRTNGASGPFVSKLGAVWLHEVMRNKPQRNWLLKELILAGQIGIVYGAPGCGKSHLVTDLCLSMSSALVRGEEKPVWFGYRGRPFGTIYIIREDRADFEIRLHSWRKERGLKDDDIVAFVFLPTALDLRSNDIDLNRLALEVIGLSHMMDEMCGLACGMLAIDTVNHVLGGGNENSPDVMGAFVINLTKLQEILLRAGLEVAILGIHHAGKTEGRGPRGHESLHGAAGFEIEVTKPEVGPNRWRLAKQRAASAGQTHMFALRRVVLAQDDDGDDITSCSVDMLTATQAPEGPPIRQIGRDGRVILKAREELAFRALVTALKLVGRQAPPHTKTTIADTCVTLADWRNEFAKLLAGENEDEAKLTERAKKARDNAAARFVNWGLIQKDGDWIWRTGKKVMNIDPPEREKAAQSSGATQVDLSAVDSF